MALRFLDALRRPLLLAAATAALLLPGTAFADVIDGDWCNSTRHITIKGPEIVTPGGTKMQGDYTRHAFMYVVPPSDPGAGQTVAMLLVNENTVHLRMGADAAAAAQAPIQIWLRCAAPVARLGVSSAPFFD